MQKQSIFISIFITAVILCSGCSKEKPRIFTPEPTDTTFVKTNMEDGTHRDLKKYWFEAVHSCNPETNWRAIENENSASKYQDLLSQKSSGQKSKLKVNIAGGSLIGEWNEKGSVNQAGSMLKTAYNKENKRLYAISDGGSLWKGNLSTFGWNVENQDLRFDGRFLDIVYPENHSYRIISSIGGVPYYKDSDEHIWKKADGFSNNYIHENKHQVILGDGKEIMFLSKVTKESTVKLYISKDYGNSYAVLKEFDSTNLDDFAISCDQKSKKLYLAERRSFISATFWKYDSITGNIQKVNSNSNISFGSDSKTNIEISVIQNKVTIYCYDHQNRFYKSIDNGQTWNSISQLPTTPWAAGVQVSPSNPNIVMLGAVEAYRSINGGRTWAKTNHWFDYYSNQSTALHADIMHIEEYEVSPSENVTIVSNHGGISLSSDLGANYVNIGLNGLNTSQYYSVRTYPYNNDYIFAGSQDQGLQRAKDFQEGPTNFSQFISGDFGHLQFTNYGRSLWAIYPGGWISYYPDPISGTLAAEFELLTNNRSVWLPPIITSPYNPNSILIAGGSLLGTSGSHIVELTVDDLTQLFANQWPYNFEVGGGEVSAMSYNQVSKNEFYVLTTNGKFFKSTDQGKSFSEKNRGLSEAHTMYGNTILTSKVSSGKVIIGGSGYDNPAVYLSHDGGESFTPMVNGLPPTSVFEMVYDEKEAFIFAATEAGPYVYVVNQEKWFDLSQGLAPNQRYWSVEYLMGADKVRYGTYGRGIWDLEIDLLSETKELETSLTSNLEVYPNPSTGVFNLNSVPNDGVISIHDRAGKLVLIKDIKKSESFSFDLTSFSNGLYYLIFDDGTKKSSSIIVKI